MNYILAILGILVVWLAIYAVMDDRETKKMYKKTKGL